jgi:hypothetical protein
MKKKLNQVKARRDHDHQSELSVVLRDFVHDSTWDVDHQVARGKIIEGKQKVLGARRSSLQLMIQ